MDTNWDRLSVRVRFTQIPSYDPNENPSDCVNLFMEVMIIMMMMMMS